MDENDFSTCSCGFSIYVSCRVCGDVHVTSPDDAKNYEEPKPCTKAVNGKKLNCCCDCARHDVMLKYNESIDRVVCAECSERANKYNNLSQFRLDSVAAIEDIDPDIIRQIINAIKDGGNVFVFGNGGSATTASHFALDATKNARHLVTCLSDNVGMLTAVANDHNFVDIFYHQIKAMVKPNDVVIGISTSGNSQNVLMGIDSATYHQAITVILTGFDGGKLAKIPHDIHLHINSDVIEAVEDAHLAALHMVVRGLKDG